MASATALGALLVHDAEVGPGLGEVALGDEVRTRGDLRPFQVAAVRAPAWAAFAALLGNHTYVLDQDEPGLLVLVASPHEVVTGEPVIVVGGVVYAGPHPTDAEGELVIVQAAATHAPLVFR